MWRNCCRKESYVVAAADSGSARPNQLGTRNESRMGEDGTERPTPRRWGCTSSNASQIPGLGETGLGTRRARRPDSRPGCWEAPPGTHGARRQGRWPPQGGLQGPAPPGRWACGQSAAVCRDACWVAPPPEGTKALGPACKCRARAGSGRGPARRLPCGDYPELRGG